MKNFEKSLLNIRVYFKIQTLNRKRHRNKNQEIRFVDLGFAQHRELDRCGSKWDFSYDYILEQ